jgi:hypothetical protein
MGKIARGKMDREVERAQAKRDKSRKKSPRRADQYAVN